MAKTPNTPAPLFAKIENLPYDVEDALDAMKLCAICHRRAGWKNISKADFISAVQAVIHLANKESE